MFVIVYGTIHTMVPTGIGKSGKMGDHFPAREKSGNFYQTGNQEILTLENGNKY